MKYLAISPSWIPINLVINLVDKNPDFQFPWTSDSSFFKFYILETLKVWLWLNPHPILNYYELFTGFDGWVPPEFELELEHSDEFWVEI